MLRVDWTRAKGRGVYTDTNFHKGDIVERVPVAVLPMWQWYHIEKTLLVDYGFLWGDEMAIPFGKVLFYNHSFTPNVYYFKKFDEHLMEIIALCDIEAGEELVANYNGDPNDTTPVWFELKD